MVVGGDVTTDSRSMVEIRWHGRGGQGAKTAALLLAEAASQAGRHVQGFPEYGPERMGAPVLAFNRISEHPITLHCHVSSPQIVAVLDPTLIGGAGVAAGVPEGGSVVVNTTADPEATRHRLKLGRRAGVTVATVDASGIAMDTIGQSIPNTPLIGAVIRVSGVLEFEPFIGVAEALLKEKFRHKPSLVEGNLRAIQRAYEEVRQG